MNRLKAVVLGVAFMALPAIAQAQSITFTFDDWNTDRPPDLPNPAPTSVCPQPQLPNGYNGFNWDNFYVLKGSEYLDTNGHPPDSTYCVVPSGYRNGVVSPQNVAFNGNGAPAAISVGSGNTFTFNSVYMTAAWNYGMSVTVQGFLGVTQVDSRTFSPPSNPLSTDHSTLEVFNWAGVDRVLFTSSGGALAFGANPTLPSTEIVFDNLTVSNVTPEPSTLLLLGTGLAGIGGVIRRRRRKNIES